MTNQKKETRDQSLATFILWYASEEQTPCAKRGILLLHPSLSSLCRELPQDKPCVGKEFSSSGRLDQPLLCKLHPPFLELAALCHPQAASIALGVSAEPAPPHHILQPSQTSVSFPLHSHFSLVGEALKDPFPHPPRTGIELKYIKYIQNGIIMQASSSLGGGGQPALLQNIPPPDLTWKTPSPPGYRRESQVQVQWLRQRGTGEKPLSPTLTETPKT